MFFKSKAKSDDRNTSESKSIIEMIDRTQAVIHFKTDGTILTANKNFLDVLGYELDEIVGKHHAMFVDPEMVQSAEYERFWSTLAAGEHTTNQFPRIAKDRSVVWIQATYAPVLDAVGNVEHIVKIASDVTKRRNAIERLASALGELRRGNLLHKVSATGITDIDAIGTAFNDATQQLCTMMQTMASTTGDVASVIQNVNKSSDDLSTRTAGQAATLEETAAALEELTVTVKSSADGAQEAEALASQTKSSAEHSNAVVAKSIDAMAEIQESSKEISKIISVIDDISFQTNLLALNAGVEAARAGEAGRGFAVVASEVRGLAHRSQEAAGEIKNLISRSSEHVTKGVDLVNGTGEELQKIIEGINAITGKMGAIARGATEQSQALAEINNGVGQLDSVTQQNASMVDDVASANQTLMQNINLMSDQMATFKTGGVANTVAGSDQWDGPESMLAAS